MFRAALKDAQILAEGESVAGGPGGGCDRHKGLEGRQGSVACHCWHLSPHVFPSLLSRRRHVGV